MNLDYGKRAYIKVTELEKRFDDFINSLAKTTVKTLTFNLATPEVKATYERVLKFNALSDGVVSLKIVLPSTNVETHYEIYHNGVELKSGKTNGETSELEITIGAYVGENEITFNLMAGMPVSTIGFTATVVGTVDYVYAKRRLSSITLSNATYVTYLENNYYTLYSYSSDKFKQLFKVSATDACIIGSISGEIYIATLEEDNGLRITCYDPTAGFSLTSTPIVKGVSSVCGYQSNGVLTLIFVKTGEVFIGEYVKNQPFTYRSAYRRGSEVFADADTPDAYVISDGYKPTKFVDFEATYVLQKGDNYHVSKNNGGYAITFSKDGKLYRQTVYDRVSKAENLGFFDEIVTLADGNSIKRVRESLTIGE